MPLFNGLRLIWEDNCLSISSAVSSRPAAMLAAIQAKLADLPEKQNRGEGGATATAQKPNRVDSWIEQDIYVVWNRLY